MELKIRGTINSKTNAIQHIINVMGCFNIEIDNIEEYKEALQR